MRRAIPVVALVGVGIALALRGRAWLSRLGDAVGWGSGPGGPIARWLVGTDPWHQGVYPVALEKLALKPDDDYLDVACGSGSLLALALESVHRAAGLDHSETAVEVARETNAAALAAGRLDLQAGDAADLPWEDGSFDAVSNLNTMHAIKDPLPILRETCRVLRPGGRFVLISQSPRSLRGTAWTPMRGAMSLHEDAELAALLRDAGFSDVAVSTPDGEHQVAVAVKPLG